MNDKKSKLNSTIFGKKTKNQSKKPKVLDFQIIISNIVKDLNFIGGKKRVQIQKLI